MHKITICDAIDIIKDSLRFLFHIYIVHIMICIIDKKRNYYDSDIAKTLLVTTIAIIIYSVFVRVFIEKTTDSVNTQCKNKQK